MFNSLSTWLNKLPETVQKVTNETIQRVGLSNNDSSQIIEEKHQHDQKIEQPSTQESNVILDDSKTNESDLLNLSIDRQKALETAKEIGNFFKSFGSTATKKLQETANNLKDVIENNTIIGDFTKENEKFVNEKRAQERREESAVPPWIGFKEEEKMKEQILLLSTDSRNFTRAPPETIEFHFDFKVAYPIALAILEQDENLRDMRFKLVPSRLTEEIFWRNYFYRVSLIKQSTQLNTLATENGAQSEEKNELEKKLRKESLEIAGDGNVQLNHEFESDFYESASVNEEEIRKEMQQLKLKATSPSDESDEWEKEINSDLENITAEELEKELNEMIAK